MAFMAKRFIRKLSNKYQSQSEEDDRKRRYSLSATTPRSPQTPRPTSPIFGKNEGTFNINKQASISPTPSTHESPLNIPITPFGNISEETQLTNLTMDIPSFANMNLAYISPESHRKRFKRTQSVDLESTDFDSDHSTTTEYSSTYIDHEKEAESWSEYKTILQKLFSYFAGHEQSAEIKGVYMTRNEVKRFLDIIEITRYWNVDKVYKIMHIKGDGKVTMNEFVAYFVDKDLNKKAEDVKKYIERHVSWGLLKKAMDIFDIVDKDGSGHLDYDEFRVFGKMLNLNEEETKVLWKTIDTNKNEEITIDELFEWFKVRLEAETRKRKLRGLSGDPATFSGVHQSFWDSSEDELGGEFKSCSVTDLRLDTKELRLELLEDEMRYSRYFQKGKEEKMTKSSAGKKQRDGKCVSGGEQVFERRLMELMREDDCEGLVELCRSLYLEKNGLMKENEALLKMVGKMDKELQLSRNRQ